MRTYELGDIVTIVNKDKLIQGDYSLKIQLYSSLVLEVVGVIYQPRGTRRYRLRKLYSSGIIKDVIFEPQMFTETWSHHKELKIPTPTFDEELL